MSDAHWDICNLLYRYAECIDSADFDGVAELLRHAEVTAEGTSMRLTDHAAIRAHFADGVRVHSDGTLRTKHVTTNPIIDVNDATGSATCRSYCFVLQASPELQLQPIWAGRYHDKFEYVDQQWRFAARHYLSDLIGDLSQHILFDLAAL